MHKCFEMFQTRRIPLRLVVGLAFISIAWPFNWLGPADRTSYAFFPLWFGLILATDGAVLARKGSSLISRSRSSFSLLFLISVVAWWGFELLNKRLANWEYLGTNQYSAFQYFLLASINFSTVIPVVLEMAELLRTTYVIARLRSGVRINPTRRIIVGVPFIGLLMLLFALVWPRYFFPFAWTFAFFVLDPLNFRLGNPSTLRWLQRGDWRPVVSLSLGALVSGFFWEMWNFYAFPKWTYHVPFVGFGKIFEMPVLGYLGYLPFGLELFAFVSFTLGIASRRTKSMVVAITDL